MTHVDLKKEQEAALARPRRAYGVLARLLFRGMDLIHGKAITYPKVRLLEILARIPYQAWEKRQYRRLDSRFENGEEVRASESVIGWGRAAQDNEFWHLEVITDKIRQDGVPLLLFRDRIVPPFAVLFYRAFCWTLALASPRTAYLLNADFEDHAEHEYMGFVKDHPELESQPADSAAVRKIGEFKSWADVFRRIGLDEREHMNDSLDHCGRPAEKAPHVSGTA